MVVVYTIPVEQRAIETVVGMGISHSDICLNTPHLLRFAAPALVVRLGAPLGRCLKRAPNSILRAGMYSAGSNCPAPYMPPPEVGAHVFNAQMLYLPPVQ